MRHATSGETELQIMDPIDNDRWERVSAHVPVSADEVARLLGTPIARVQRLTAGLANTNVRVERPGQPPAVLRIHQRDPVGAEVERRVLAAVAHRVPVPRILDQGTDGPGGLPWTLTQFVEGQRLSEILEAGRPAQVSSAGRSLGRALAALHEIRLAGPGLLQPDLSVGPLPGGATSFDALLLACLDEAPVQAALGSDRSSRLGRYAVRHVAWLPAMDGTLCHGDFKGSNVLVGVDGDEVRVTALLDWEFAFAGHPLFDLAALLRFEDVLPPQLEAGVVSGITEAGGSLPSDYRAQVRAIDLVNLCSMLPRAPIGSVMRSDLLGRIDVTLAMGRM